MTRSWLGPSDSALTGTVRHDLSPKEFSKFSQRLAKYQLRVQEYLMFVRLPKVCHMNLPKTCCKVAASCVSFVFPCVAASDL